MINWKEKTTTIIQKVVCFLFVCSQTTYVLAQHYSGRHVDDFDGNGSESAGFLKEKYGITWYTPAELNPDVKFD